MTPFPRQFRFIPVVLAPPQDSEAVKLARFLQSLCLPQQNDAPDPKPKPWVDSLTLPSDAPECVNGEKWFAALADDERRQSVRSMSEKLAERLREDLPRLEGETDVEVCVTALAKSFAGLPAGTVVYDRRTDRSHVLFLMEHIQIGLRTGLHQLVGLPELPPAAPVVTRPQRHHARAMASVSQDDTAKDCAFAVASCLAWTAGPYGPVVAAGVSLLQVFYGGHSDDGPDVEELIDRSTQEIKSYIASQRISSHAAELSAFSTWMASKVTEMGKVRLGSATDSTGIKVFDATIPETIRELRVSTGPNGDAYKAIFDLKDNYVDTEEGLAQCGLAVGLYLMGLKMIMQLELQQIAWLLEKDETDPREINRLTSLWLGDYSVLVTALESNVTGGSKHVGGVVTQAKKAMTAAIARAKAERLAKLSIGRKMMTGVDYSSKGEAFLGTYSAEGWFWKDGDDEHQRIDRLQEVGEGCCAKVVKVSFEAETRAEYDKHRAQVVAELEKKYSPLEKTISLWMASLQEWREHTPPGRPSAPPSLDPDGWVGKPPIPKLAPGWVEGNTVAYAVSFANTCGPSHISEYSEPQPIRPATGATLVRFPVDPLKRATKIYIHRQITTAQGTPLPSRIAGIVDADTTRWHDGPA